MLRQTRIFIHVHIIASIWYLIIFVSRYRQVYRFILFLWIIKDFIWIFLKSLRLRKVLILLLQFQIVHYLIQLPTFEETWGHIFY
jgi:hypothetical protein